MRICDLTEWRGQREKEMKIENGRREREGESREKKRKGESK